MDYLWDGAHLMAAVSQMAMMMAAPAAGGGSISLTQKGYGHIGTG
ncbi:MAG: hypothetical protein JWQ89_2955, partial [Devosia sp.]|nr:hypothetical protein [Devosia sp.]